MTAVTRRSLLQKLALLFAGVIAWMSPAPLAAAAGTEPRTPAPAPPGRDKLTDLTLQGQGWHMQIQGNQAGRLPARGDVLSVHGQLLADPKSEPVGVFHGACFCSPAPVAQAALAATHEFHTFVLPDGSISGMGVAGTELGAAYSFAIVGGTGRFAGATGHYTASQDPLELGGDGTAEFKFTFTN